MTIALKLREELEILFRQFGLKADDPARPSAEPATPKVAPNPFREFPTDQRRIGGPQGLPR